MDNIHSERRDVDLAQITGSGVFGGPAATLGFAVGGLPGAVLGSAIGGAGGNWLGEHGYYGLRALAVTALSHINRDFQRLGDGRQDEGLPGWVDYMRPLVIDLNKDNKFDLRGAYEQNVKFDLEWDGEDERVGWVGPKDGIVIFDGDFGGFKYNEIHEMAFTIARPPGLTDLGALAFFDLGNAEGRGRADGKINALDKVWQYLDLLVDQNQNGRSDAGEMRELRAHGIIEISLGYTAGATIDLTNGNIVYGVGNAGSYRFADVAFAIAGRTATAPEALPLNDTCLGTTAHDTIDAGSGLDRIEAGSGNDVLYGGTGLYADTLFGQPGHDKLYGSEGDDYLSGGTGNDQLFGGTGIDTLFGSTGEDIYYGGSGADVFLIQAHQDEDRIIDFTRGVDNLDLRSFNYSSFATLKAASHMVASGLYVNLAGSGAVILSGFDSPNDLSAGRLAVTGKRGPAPPSSRAPP